MAAGPLAARIRFRIPQRLAHADVRLSRDAPLATPLADLDLRVPGRVVGMSKAAAFEPPFPGPEMEGVGQIGILFGFPTIVGTRERT